MLARRSVAMFVRDRVSCFTVFYFIFISCPRRARWWSGVRGLAWPRGGAAAPATAHRAHRTGRVGIAVRTRTGRRHAARRVSSRAADLRSTISLRALNAGAAPRAPHEVPHQDSLSLYRVPQCAPRATTLVFSPQSTSRPSRHCALAHREQHKGKLKYTHTPRLD